MFQFNPDKYNFWKIYDAIKRCYPIGVTKEEGSIYYSYPGLKALEEIIVDNIHNNAHFIERWVNFTAELGKEIGKEINGTTYGQAPSFSSYVLVDTVTIEDITRRKELHFFVSLVGPFYTIIGQDNNLIIENDAVYRSTNYLVVSPEKEYADAFILLCEKIENQFKGFRFVPYKICMQTIEGLSARYTDEKSNSIFHALFNNQIDFSAVSKIGNGRFKLEDWIITDKEN
ncbi:MAG: hypothetical protein ABI002_01085 [Saprospiraceae bacterium]